MIGMIQILTYLLAFYLVLKGVEILQIALASNRPKRTGIILLGTFVLAASVLAAVGFTQTQDEQAHAVGSHPTIPGR